MAAIRQTPLYRMHERAGASFAEHHGWRVPAYFTWAQKEAEQLATSAGISDVSWMTKLDLKGWGTKNLPAVHDARAWCLGPQHYLVTCEPAKRGTVQATLEAVPATDDLSLAPPIYVTDVTSVFAQFLIGGPRSVDVLRKLTSMNVGAWKNLACGQASVAHVHSIVLRDDIDEVPAFHVLVSREYGVSVWEAILHAGHEFHVTPAGFKALEFLGGKA